MKTMTTMMMMMGKVAMIHVHPRMAVTMQMLAMGASAVERVLTMMAIIMLMVMQALSDVKDQQLEARGND